MKVGFETVVGYVPETVLTRSHFFYLEPLMANLPEGELSLGEWPDEIRRLRDDNATEIMAETVTRKALDRSGLNPSDIDFIIASNAGGRQIMPMVGTHIHHSLGFNEETPVVNIMDACAGFLDAVNVAWNLVLSGVYKRVMVVVVATHTGKGQGIDQTDPNAPCFGDGAGAAIVSSQNLKCEFLAFHNHIDGSGYDVAGMVVKPLAHPELAEKAGVENRVGVYHTQTRTTTDGEIKIRALEVIANKRVFVDFIDKAFKRTNLTLPDLDMFIMHHIGPKAEENCMKGLEEAGVKDAGDKLKCSSFYNKYGNMANADIPVDLAELWEEGQIPNGSIIALYSPGSGFQVPLVLIKWVV